MRTRFLIASRARTGSHMLDSALRQHSDITCFDEAARKFRDKGFLTTQQILDRVYSPSIRSCTGMILHDFQGNSQLQRDLRERIRSEVNPLRVIILRRDNYLAKYVSGRVAGRIGRWNVRREKDRRPIPQFEIVWEDLLSKFCSFEDSYTKDVLFWEGTNSMRLSYEDMVENYDEVMTRVQTFLDVPLKPIKPITLKLTNKPLREIVLNYDSVIDQLKHTKWEYLIKEFAL